MAAPDKFLVIGSNSFSGASFVDFLLRKGADVIGVSRSPRPIVLSCRTAGQAMTGTSGSCDAT